MDVYQETVFWGRHVISKVSLDKSNRLIIMITAKYPY